MPMETLLPLADQVAALLKQRRETITVAESSSGGLLSAALLAVPGASAYFLGGAVVYTRDAPGHSCLAIVGMAGAVQEAITLETGSADRAANMRAFAAAGLELLKRHLSQ